MNKYEVLRRPLLSEKTQAIGLPNNQYTFEVDRHASKVQIREAVESLFGVSVRQVRTANMPGKERRWGRKMVRRAGVWKKAVVSLAVGQTIDVFQA